MPIDIKYIGTQQRWPELAVTGKQSVWMPGQEEERSDAEANALLATGLFERSASGAVLTPNEVTSLRAMVTGAWKFPADQNYMVPASPATITVGAANAATAISGSVLVPANQSGAFLLSGGPLGFDKVFNRPVVGKYTGTTSHAYGAVEFSLDTLDSTGRFELSIRGDSDASNGRVLYRFPGETQWKAVSAGRSWPTMTSDGNGYLVLVTLGAAGRYEIRLEGVRSLLYGVRVAPGSAVTALKPKTGRAFVIGDSFTEPTINEVSFASSPADGWVNLLNLRTGWDVWAAGKGGSGFLAGGAGNTFTERWNNELRFYARPGDRVFVAGGINDSTYAYSEVYPVALALFQSIKATGAELYVVSPFLTKGTNKLGVTSYLQVYDAVKDACTATGGRFIDLTFMPQNDVASGFETVVVAGSGGSRLKVADIPALYKNGATTTGGQLVRLGTGATQQVAQISYIDGSAGNWGLEFNGEGVTYTAWAVGTRVVFCGRAYITGSGKQGATVGDGSADIYTGPDGTHPTRLGHINLADCVLQQIGL